MIPTRIATLGLNDLRERITQVIDRAHAIERQIAGNIDPRWATIAFAVTTRLDAAEEALLQAELAIDVGDGDRARRRLNTARQKLSEASQCLGEVETLGLVEEVV